MTSALLAFWGVAFALAATPGADWAYTISAGIRSRRVAPAVAGIIAGHTVHLLLVAAGLGALLAAHPEAMTLITLLGALYLGWLGVGILRTPTTPALPNGTSLEGGATLSVATVTDSRWFVTGVGVSLLNPKVLLLLVAVLPQFVDSANSTPYAAQVLALGAVHLLTCAVVYLAVGRVASRVLGVRPTAALWVSRISGVMMLGISAVLIGSMLLL